MQTTQEMLDQLRDEVAQLRASRTRLALAGDAERRQLERELHDGQQQRLVALAVTLQLARDLVHSDSARADALLEEVASDLQHALEGAAALAHQIYPPLLDAGGLGPALRASSSSSRARIEVDGELRLPPGVAGAVYFGCVDLVLATDAQAVAVYEEDGAAVFEVTGNRAAEPSAREVLLRVRDRVEAFGGRLAVTYGAEDILVRGSLPLGG